MMRDLIGQQLGNYRLVKLLGRGGFAEVYLGQHVQIDTQQAAIKVLYLIGVDPHKFRQEAQTIASLKHPNIIRLFDFSDQQDMPYLVMDYAPNGSLGTRHATGEKVPLATVVQYVTQITSALQYAHGMHIIHRDIKPDNVLLGSHSELLLSDFGIAVLSKTGRATVNAPAGTAGTPYYMAPEMFRGKPDKASDQYALAVMVYQWLSGTLPFSEGDFIQLGYQHAYEPVPPLRERAPLVSEEVEAVVMKALAKDLSQRFATVQAFATALEKASQATQKPVGAVVEEIVLPQRFSPQPSSSLPPTVLAPPAIATPTNLKTSATQIHETSIAVPPPAQTSPSTTVTPPTVQAASPPTRPEQHYLTAVILGVFLSLVNILFMQMIPIWAGVDPYPTPLQALPSYVVSLIAGVTLGTRREARKASLLAGLIISLPGFVFMLVKYALNGTLPYMPPEAWVEMWVLVVATTSVCGPLPWLVAWMRTRPHAYER